MDEKTEKREKGSKPENAGARPAEPTKAKEPAREVGGRDGPEPTRYGDWEVNGICVDF
ncbi:MAG: DUF1674 domain-containing protein [Alphaproteobacteria bacterium]|jgi:hypothetical protein|nr:DUF1674 domain-containing protein [Alphaproteobacteria bacterium]